MTKQELRLHFKNFLAKNQALINSDSVKASIINKINNLLEELKIKTVGIYYPLKYEINLTEIIKLRHKTKFFLPKIIENQIRYCSYNNGDKLTLGDFNICEPINNDFFEPELVIIPGLAFDKENYRLGYGKGHFDRYIDNNTNILTVGVCLQEQIIANFPIEAHDKKVNFIITKFYENYNKTNI